MPPVQCGEFPFAVSLSALTPGEFRGTESGSDVYRQSETVGPVSIRRAQLRSHSNGVISHPASARLAISSHHGLVPSLYSTPTLQWRGTGGQGSQAAAYADRPWAPQDSSTTATAGISWL